MKKDEHNIDFNLFGDYELAGCYIEITSRCNLRCKHCYNESGELRKELDLQAFLNAYDGMNHPLKIWTESWIRSYLLN